MDSTDLSGLFEPESIALVGASADPEKIAGRPQRYLEKHGYAGETYLVNPSREAIEGEPCYDSVADVPGPVDLALVMVPAAIVPSVIRECGEAGASFAVVIASGFSESGGEDREAELLEAARESGVGVVGPNCEGMVNVPGRVGASFSSILKRDDLIEGGLSFLTQSGAFGGALFQLTQDLGVGAAKWLSTGNEADLGTVDFLEYLVEDPGTDAVAMYVESLERGERLRAVGRRAIETDTDLVAVRVGRSERGREATASHTGSIASDDAVYDAMFDAAGITRVRGVDGFTDTVAAVSRVPSDRYPRTGDGVGLGVVTISGGAGVLIADTADDLGLPLADLDPGTRATIEEGIPEYGSTINPVDVTGTAISKPEMFERTLRVMAGDDAVTALLLQFGNSGPETLEVCKGVLYDLCEELPIATVFTGGVPTEEARAELADAGVLYFEDPVRAVETFDKLAERARFRETVPTQPVRALPDDREPLPSGWDGVTDALAGHGVGFVPTVAVDSADAAVEAASEVGYPVVMKYSPLDVDHKAEVGGVHTGLGDAGAVRSAYRALAGRDAAVLLQRSVGGTEAIVGVVDDDDFGPTMMVGPGGTFVELLDDFAYRGLPVTEGMARDMIGETVLDRLLGGFRDRPPGDVDALASCIAAVSDAYEAYDVSELELNPVIVNEEGAHAVDLLVR